LIEEDMFQKTVIDLIIKFYYIQPNVFSNIISSTFVTNNFDNSVSAISRFSQFWKLTSEFYPETVFFENGDSIFKMLDFLDHDNPMLRHLSKSWLSQSIDQFDKIVDPLIKKLLSKSTSWFISPKGKIYFSKEYDNTQVIDAFRKLKNIIINMTELAINYFSEREISDQLSQLHNEIFCLGAINACKSKYLDIIISISLRFIQAKVFF
jgi:hypothetical protein